MTGESTWRTRVACLPPHPPSCCTLFALLSPSRQHRRLTRSFRCVPGGAFFLPFHNRVSRRIARLIARDLSAIQARYATNGDANWTNLWHFLTTSSRWSPAMEAESIRVIETCPMRRIIFGSNCQIQLRNSDLVYIKQSNYSQTMIKWGRNWNIFGHFFGKY